MLHIFHLYIGNILVGIVKDFILTIVAVILSVILGILFATGRLYGPRIIRILVIWYVELIRGLPAILQLFIIFFGFTQIGINFSPLQAALIWLVAYGTGYAVEIFRSGIMDVAQGQREAASALGLSNWLTLRKIVIPQAFTVMLPALMNFIILQLKNTTLLYLIGYADTMYQATLGASALDNPGPLYLMAAGVYLILALVIGVVGNRMEKRAAAYR